MIDCCTVSAWWQQDCQWGMRHDDRLLHSPNLVAVGLSVGYGTWLPCSIPILCVVLCWWDEQSGTIIAAHEQSFAVWNLSRWQFRFRDRQQRPVRMSQETVIAHQPSMVCILISIKCIWKCRLQTVSRLSRPQYVRINSLWPSDAIGWHRCGSTSAQVMACCLMAQRHYLNRSWRFMRGVLWHSPKSNFTRSAHELTIKPFI